MESEDYKKLADPFAENVVKWREAGGGNRLAYTQAHIVQGRLDEVCGAGFWQTSVNVVAGSHAEVGIGIQDDGCWIWKWNTAAIEPKKGNIDPIKEATSDAFKRAASCWGIGRYLRYFEKDNGVVEGQSLPAWALPGGCGTPHGPTRTLEETANIVQSLTEAIAGCNSDEMRQVAMDVKAANLPKKDRDALRETYKTRIAQIDIDNDN